MLIPAVYKGIDCGLGLSIGNKVTDFKKAVIGNMYICGEILNEDQKKILEKYVRRKGFFKIGRYKKS